MLLANPIYDSAFKYLLEDLDIAKGLIGRIIGEEIVELSLRPTELHIQSETIVLLILRIDFKAIIKTKSGEYKKVLIEIQKGKNSGDVLRFRRYLGNNYRKADMIKTDQGKEERVALPIITIYFLGFRLKTIKTPVVKTKRTYEDLVTNLVFEKEQEDFIELLTHDTYVIQIPRLHQRDRNHLERVLKVFNQSYRWSDDNRLVVLSEQETKKDPLLQKMAKRLLRAAADEELLAKMDLEEEVEATVEKYIRESQQLKEKLKKEGEEKKQLKEKLKEEGEEKKQLKEKLKEEGQEKKQLKEEAEQLKEKLQKQKEEAMEQLILYTGLSDEQIAQIQDVAIAFVKELRQKVEE